jgi:glycosyltransferase involved in cell wall biosynthesis
VAAPPADPLADPDAPLASVVVPTRDRAPLLAATVRAALAQRGVAVEVVVVDDGSAGGATARALAGLADPRLAAIRHPHPLGVSAARNAGVAAARGRWVAFLDDDDLWAPDKLARQLAAAERLGRAWACSGSVSVAGAALRVVAGAPPPGAAAIAAALPRRNVVPAGASNVVARADALARAGGFDPALRHMADWDLWRRLARLGPPAVVDEPDVAYRLHDGNASADSAAIAHEIARVEARAGGAPVDRAFAHRWTAWNLMRAGRRGPAARAYLRAAAAGDVASVARAAVALAYPGVTRRPMARFGADPAWAARADAWLDAFRA